MKHLTEKELIEYQFKLASDTQMKEAAEHIEGCDQCRGNLEKLQRKYAALDLLGGEAKISEELISRVTEQTGKPIIKRIAWFKRPVWMSSAAAVLVVGLLLISNQIREDGTAQREIGKEPMPKSGKMEMRSSQSIAPTTEMEVASKPEKGPTKALHKDVPRKAMLAMEPQKEAADMYVMMDEASDDAISEQPPFAPASAIELVTLPRRDKVQLTIYNSAFRTSISDYEGYGGFGGMIGPRNGGGMGGGYMGGNPGAAVDDSILKAPDLRPHIIPRGPVEAQSNSLTLVREKRNLTMKKGWNWLQFMWINTLIDPTSLSLEALGQEDKIDIQQLVFPARLRELGRWLIHSEVSGQVPFEITYFTSGISWRAFYMGTLSENEKTMQLQGYVRVTNNSGEDYEEAETRLIVGNVHILDEIAELAQRQYPYKRPGIVSALDFIDCDIEGRMSGIKGYGMMGGMGGGMMGGGMGGGMRLRRKEIIKEGLSEYFLYTIEGTETIPNQWGKRLQSFDIEDIEVESLYKYDEQRWGNQTIRFVKFENNEEHNLGQTPIPNGDVKIYCKADSEGYLSYVGGTNIKYIPVDEEVELNLGPARLVKVEPKLMDFKTDNYVFDRRGNVAGWDEIRTWKIEITNTRELPIEIEITRGFGTTYWTIQSEAAYEKYDATQARFKVNLEPRNKLTLEYTVTTYHGTREGVLTKNNN
ncbi:MAG: DUF4139 domain-containing protein [Planctomycetes bacterium]|nr:DUF4139 domain-containing protein [Planctomycetota bacterium]